jgi:serine phosphatase RsbU (regulator of sigma subunit)
VRETIEPTDSEPDPAARESDDLATLEVATYFRAGGQGTVVGGDWYDVIELPDGCTALVIGDVMGRGVRAAAVMTQVRDVVRTYARMGVSPLELMGSLDHLVAARFPEHFVTCVYAVFDHADLSLQLVNAGHVPPLLTHPDGSCTRVTAAPHPPLGVGRAFEDLHRVVLSPGAGLVLYTDGLVERRRVDVEAGIESLRRTVAGLDVPVREAPEAIVHAQLPVVPDDDVAMLVVRVRELRPGRG